MNRPELKAILQNQYDRSQWISTLQFLTGKREYLTVNLSPKSIEVDTQEADRLVKSFHQIGTLKTSDGAALPIFEIILKDDIRIEYNRVGVNEFIKKFIIKDAIKGALATFSYDNDNEKTEWRFSFISKNSASDFFAEAEATETNPKKYTYIFGNKEEHRTAIERLYNLEQSRFRLEDFFEAFNVEPVSKKFFEEYKHLYREFSSFIAGEPTYLKLFEDREINDNKERNDKAIKEVRNFVSRLLGRIVFLYFLQKKNWLGASSTEYKDGSTTFLSDLFFNDPENQNDFYKKYLCPIFFEALNTDRTSKKDVFKLENGDAVCIPFLNGGLFEEEQEPEGHRDIKIPNHQFEMLFNFFNGFNFTVYENSPEEHTVAVDPEMLGHIFENLIDYNKDTGTFYTPKEIVQYMTQESLVEYLNTHLQKERSDIENIVKNHNTKGFTYDELSTIDQLLDDVKICDPAIGSGAFPMGMLQEIFNLKALINFNLGKIEEWKPEDVKKDIIQKSIYGVDLDEGAVEIARLRFWLSLVVDAQEPEALPNLDYKIMQGNSLLESYKGIDLSGISSGNDLKIVEEMQTDLWGNLTNDQMKMTIGKSGLAEEIQKLIKKYFTAKAIDKRNIKNKIESKISEHIEFNIELRENQLLRQIEELKTVKTLKPNQKKALEKYREDLDLLLETKTELKKEQKKDEKNYFLWHLFFGDVLSKGGFDIVIGNPPYIKEYTNKSAFDGFRNSPYYQGKMDIWYGFACKSLDILKESGIECFIAQNNWITSAGASIFRNKVLQETEIKLFTDFWNYKVFKSAGIQTMVYVLKKIKPRNEYDIRYSLLKDDTIKESELPEFLNYYTKQNFSEKSMLNFAPSLYHNSLITFNNPLIDNIIDKILANNYTTLSNNEVAQGVVFPQDKLNKKNANILGTGFNFNDGIFLLTKKEIEKLNLNNREKDIIRPFYTTRELDKYVDVLENLEWIIYAKSDLKNQIHEFPNIKNHLDRFAPILTSDNKPYGLHRARKEDFFVGEKIISLRKNHTPSFTYTNFDCFVSQTFYSIKSNRFNLKYLTVLLNSKLIAFWLRYKGKMQGDNYQIDKEPLVEIPIVQPNQISQYLQLFEVLVSTLKSENKYSDTIENKQIANFFEEVIDGLVFDLYFEEETKSKDIYITDDVKASLKKYNVEDNFEAQDDQKKKEIILSLYKDWSTGTVQIKMADYVVKSPTILKPILQN